MSSSHAVTADALRASMRTDVPSAPFLLGRLRTTGRPGQPGPRSGWDRWRGRHLLTISTAAFGGEFLLSDGDQASIRTGGTEVTLLLHGEIQDATGPTSAEHALDSYLSMGSRFVRDLHGSFAFVIVDGRSDRLYVLTDPVNSRKVYFQAGVGRTWIATCHAFPLLPLEDASLDELGLVQYLVNGIPLRGRTLFRDVRVLGRGAVHRFGRRGWESETYWSYEFQPPIVDQTCLRYGLKDRLMRAVRRSVQDRPRTFLSLSGGYDSSAILGALDSLGVRELRCFSYASNGAGEPGDANVARRMCDRLGYPHEVISAYRDPLAVVLRENALHGHGLTRLVVETDAWRAVRSAFESRVQTVLLVGDECLGWKDAPLHTTADVLRVLGIRGWDGVKWLEAWLPEVQVRRWDELVREDLRDLSSTYRAGDDLRDLRDVLYLEERLPRLLSWRENFAGSQAKVRYPLLDREILEFMRRVPAELRGGKKLFRQVVRDAFPTVFGIPRAQAAGWIVKSWAECAVRDDAATVRELILSGESPLDRYLPPEALLRLHSLCEGPSPSRRVLPRAFWKMRRFLGRIGASGRGLPPLPPSSESVLLVRALFLRVHLREQHSTRNRLSHPPRHP